MFKKICAAILAIFLILPNVAISAEMVNVEYVHNILRWRWGIDLPYNTNLTNPHVAANMKYLLTVVDIANKRLNGEKTTDYGNSDYATLAAADTVATNTAIDTLVRGPGFYLTTTPDTTNFSITITAAGNFAIDWGDGERESIVDKPVAATTYSHTFKTPQSHTIRITGTATDYSDANNVKTLSFNNNAAIARINGNLGSIFPTLSDGTNPRFTELFNDATNLTGEIPSDLFDGITGAATTYMFGSLFRNCSKLTGEIPADLFAGITGPLAQGTFEASFYNCSGLSGSIPGELFSRITSDTHEVLFNQTFRGCTGLSGSIPGDLFQGIRGTPRRAMFFATFRNCSNITGSIPGELFAGIQGAPATSVFAETFAYTGLTGSIPGELFSGIQGAPAHQLFSYTFAGNRRLTGQIPGELFAGLQGAPAPYVFSNTFAQCSGLDNHIPADLFAGIRGQPAEGMFERTFNDAGVSSIPDGLFADIQGEPANFMFESTFNWNPRLNTIPDGLFAGISGSPATNMFSNTFNYTSITNIPDNLFGTFTDNPANGMFTSTFANCQNLTGPSAKNGDGRYLYEVFTNITSDMNTYENSPNLSDYDQIPNNWK